MALVEDKARPAAGGTPPTNGGNITLLASKTEGHIETQDTDGSTLAPTLMTPPDHNAHITPNG